ncbi:XRE family transcriptional regulator [Plesiomonas shigelloides]|uniref:XRE family transcriptional regulator n=1 Tax=Plesiomonas shigelloides TaxID=703 RepID=UPI000DFCC955|nr:helix-turn-helix transcriptional regulator [Plesiomonas shigelloides]MDO4671640.1 helix-turn-helix transcriptional regulator [Porphyromonadaceae bacterium]SUB63863.1 Uncharacterized HTH-type transcriptional regulator HI_1476 [Plesiomonas shigelloides]
MKTTFAERLKLAMRDAGYTQAALADKAGMTQAGIQKLTSGKAKTSTKLLDIASALGVRAEWLSSGDGAMRELSGDIPQKREWSPVLPWDSQTPVTEEEVEIPYLKDIEFACGSGCYSENDYNGFKLRFSKSTLRKVGANSDGSGVICFPVRGDSMEPNIPDGTTVAVNIHDKKIIDGKIYAINENGWKRLKLLYRVGPDLVSLRSFNSVAHPPEEKSLQEIEIIGRVFWWAVLDY